MAKSVHPDLFSLLRAYSALVPVRTLSFPHHLPVSEVQEFLVEYLLLNPHLLQYAPSKQYQCSFWKWVIQNLEQSTADEDFELNPRIYARYLAILPPSAPAFGAIKPGTEDQYCPRGAPLQSPPKQSYITHYWKSPSVGNETEDALDIQKYHTVTLLESRTTIEAGTTGLRTWLASFVLSQYLIMNPDLVEGKRILELGSGTGFLGIIAASIQVLASTASAQQAEIWLSDVNDTVRARCTANIKLPCNLSHKHPRIGCWPINWDDALQAIVHPALQEIYHRKINADLVLGADIVFDPSLIAGLVAALKYALGPANRSPQRVALIALTVRNEETLAKFLSAAGELFDIEVLPVQPDKSMFLDVMEGGDDVNNGVKIFRMTYKH